MTPIRSHQESSIEILEGTFEHMNGNPLFDEPPPIKGNKILPKYPKRTLRLDLSHMMQQHDAPKGTCTLGIPNILPLEENQQSTPFLLTLPNIMTSNVMEPLMSTTCEASTSKIPMDVQRKSLISITPIPKRNASHY